MAHQNIDSHRSKNIWSGIFLGIGLMALVDEIIFHQLLQWHHFYDHSTTFIGILSDGLLNLFALFALVIGFFMFADSRRKKEMHKRRWIGGIFTGLGIFQLFDGIINHKLLRIHQVRYDVNILPYDLAWNIAGAIFLITGIVIIYKSKRESAGN